MADDLDHIEFGWSPSTLTGYGWGPVGTSLSPDQLREWTDRLGPHVRPRLAPTPLTHLAYLEFPGASAALLMRRGTGDHRAMTVSASVRRGAMGAREAAGLLDGDPA